MKKEFQKKIKIINNIFLILLLLECGYIVYSLSYNNKESLYFDGINKVVMKDNYYIAVGSNNDNDKKYEKAKISKYNEKREKTFEQLYNVGYNSAFFGVCLDNNSFVAVGSYENTKHENKSLIRRALIVKYDLEGNILFEKDLKVLDNSKFTSVISVDDGYLVTGQSVYKNTQVGEKSGGAILAKYDKNGDFVWMKMFGSNKSAIFNDLLLLDDNIYTVGTDSNHVGFICKYDLDGNLITSNDYMYIDDLGFSGIVNIDDNIYVSGANRDGDTTNGMIVKYDLDCNYVDEVIYASEGTIRYNKIIKDDNNNLVAIGTISSKKESTDKTAEQLNYDGIIGKYDSSLKEIQVEKYGDDRDDYFTDILCNNGGYLVTGYSSYEDGSYLSKFINYSDALKQLDVN